MSADNHIIFKSMKCSFIFKFICFFILLVSVLVLGIKYLCFKNCLTLTVWWLFFSGLHYLICFKAKCPENLTPPVTVSIVIIILYISGLFGSLHPGFFVLLFTGIFGIINIIIDKKSACIKFLFKQPLVFNIYYFLGILLFIQAYYLSKGIIAIDVSNSDDLHHWGLIANGMCNYHKLSEFTRSIQFDNYTLGTTIWIYFINRLSGVTFRIFISHWANSLLSISFFVPFLFYNNKHYEEGKNFTLLYFILIILWLFYILQFYLLFLILLIIFLFYIIYNRNANVKNFINIFAFSASFLLYSTLLVLPGYFYSTYRTFMPDNVIALSSLSIAAAYILNPNLNTLIWITPIIPLSYLFKTPGLFYSLLVFIPIFIHFVFKHLRYFLISIRGKYNSTFIKLYLLPILFMILAFLLPVFLWSTYCSNNVKESSVEFTTKPKKIINLILDSKKNPNLKKYYDEFINTFKDNNIFLYSNREKSTLSLLNKLFKTDKFTPTYLFFTCTLLFTDLLLLLLFIKDRKFNKLLFLFLISLLIFSVLHLIFLFFLYVLYFTYLHHLTEYQRYTSPILKIHLGITFSFFLLFINKSDVNFKFKLLISILVLIFISCFSKDVGPRLHLKQYPEDIRIKAVLNSLNFNTNLFLNKKLCVISNNIYCRDDDYIGLLLMYYPKYSPKLAKFLSFSNLKKEKPTFVNKYDYFWFIQDEEISDLSFYTNSIPNNLLQYIEDVSCLKKSCVFERNNNNVSSPLKLIYENDHIISNLILNSDFKNSFKYYDFDNKQCLTTNNNMVFCLLNKNNKYVKQKVTLKSNHYYKISFDFFGEPAYPFGELDGEKLFFKQYRYDFKFPVSNKRLRTINYYIYNVDEKETFFYIYYNKKRELLITNIKILDLGINKDLD